MVSGLATKALPYLSAVAKPLATGAASALGALGLEKLVGKGQVGGFLIPQDKVDKLIQHKNLLTKSQTEQILNALQNGGQIVINPTPQQRGGFLGTLLASIGVPLLLNALTGKGLQNRGPSGRGLRNRGGNINFSPLKNYLNDYYGINENSVKKIIDKGKGMQNRPAYYASYRPPPFYGQWGEGNKKGSGLLLGPNSPLKNVPLLGAIF